MLNRKSFVTFAKEINAHTVLILGMLYVTCKLTCNPLFFRQINLSYPIFNMELKVVGSALVFPIIYILSDLIVAVSNRKTAIFIIIIGILCDGFFSYSVNYVSSQAMPNILTQAQLANTQAINTVGNQIWKLFVHGVVATIIANVVEVLIFATIFKKIKNFFLSTIISVFIILLFHNIITDYPMLKAQKDAWNIIFNGLWVNMSILTIYAAFFSILIWIKNTRSLSSTQNS